MSWIKKIFTMFQNDDENEIDDINPKQRVSKPLHPERKQTKELEARVVYQYPKGQFRFPLVPDEEIKDSEHRPKKTRRENAQSVTEVKPLYKEKSSLRGKRKNDPVKEPSSKFRHEPVKEPASKLRHEPMKEPASKLRHEPVKESASNYRPETRKESGPKFRKPFKPTEIPSPIHAFNRPPRLQVKKADEVEYELSGFDREQETSEKRLSSEEYENSIKQNVSEEIVEEFEIPEDSHNEIYLEDDLATSSSEVEMIAYSVPENEFNDVQLDEGNREENAQQNLPALEVKALQPNHEVKDRMAMDVIESEGHSETRASVERIGGGAGSDIDADKKDDYEQGNPGERPEKRTRQLPFNVIMLKQDKRKWDEQNVPNKPHFRSEGIKTEAAPVSPVKAVPEMASSESKPSTSIPKEPLQAEPADKNRDSASLIPELTGIQDDVNPVANQEVIQAVDEYEFPPLSLLSPPVFKEPDPQWLAEQEHMLNETLRNFNVGAKVVNMTQGPSVTRFEVQPEPGVKVNKITNLSDDIKLSLAAKDIRIEAPIPGKHTIGIEVPNHSSRPVLLSEILQAGGFLDHESPLTVALGLDIAGNPIVTDLKKMPHGLIAGATGSGKSVCINTMLVSLLYKAHPNDVKLLLIDPKMVELAPYNQIPHLVSPVITDVKAATASLKWAVEEMERRYELFAHTGVRDINRFNELAVKHRRFSDKLPFIVIVIDELADLMMMAPTDVEEAICRIAQKARACGIHLIVATQRPSVDVITGLIKANVPTRIAFSVSSQVDSRTIIDISGAEKLLGRGDMLFLENGSSKPFRLQGTFVTDNEIDDIVAFVREQRAPEYLFEQEELLRKAQITEDEDELFYEACEFVVEQGGASTSSVQRRFKIGYNRAARLIEMMQQQGFISEGKGSKPRDVLISAADLESLQEN